MYIFYPEISKQDTLSRMLSYYTSINFCCQLNLYIFYGMEKTGRSVPTGLFLLIHFNCKSTDCFALRAPAILSSIRKSLHSFHSCSFFPHTCFGRPMSARACLQAVSPAAALRHFYSILFFWFSILWRAAILSTPSASMSNASSGVKSCSVSSSISSISCESSTFL
ncbi:hypothetical protein UYO_1566 [Lachnospiraceae bacterium JC7]|nr:hypothetical protein UYO_1566 [Lachnospiraceae bacterium JC7]